MLCLSRVLEQLISACVGEWIAKARRSRTRRLFRARENIELQPQRRLWHDHDPCRRLVTAQCVAVLKHRIGHTRDGVDVCRKLILSWFEGGDGTIEARRESRFAYFETFAFHDDRSGNGNRRGVVWPPGRAIVVIPESRVSQDEREGDRR